MVDKSSEKARRRRGRKGEGSVTQSKKPIGKKIDNSHGSASKVSKTLLIQLTNDAPTWYQCGRQTPGRDDTITTDPPSPSDPKIFQLISRYRTEAEEIYRREVQLFGNDGSADERWVENTMKRGTLKDRIAAMSVIVSTNPVHKLYALDGLLQMAGCSGGQTNARMAQMAAEALEDLFLNTLLPPKRKLLSLDQRPLYRYEGQKMLSPRILLLWRYEEMIKEKYQLFLQHYLMQTLKDGMEMAKLSALRSAGTLLQSSPEGEVELLSMIVNKLGDPLKKIAAASGHELRRVLERHANMQVVIAREVQQLAHRPHLSPRALYNCIIFLNQLKLVAEDPVKDGTKDNLARSSKAPKESSLPASLINTYFRLFEVAVSKSRSDDSNSSSGMKSRLLSALLTGVNRAHPYLPEKDKDLEEHIDSLYRVVHTGPPSASTQALMLLFHVAVGSEDEKTSKKSSQNVTAKRDRFYRALYATLSQPSIIGAGKHLTLYFNLLYKAMKHDSNSARVVAFAKRLLCTTMHTNPPVTAASLFLLNEIMKYHPELKSCFTDVTEGRDATAVLDPTKREPTVALVSASSEDQGLIAHAPLWETALLSHHFHPSVAKFASTMGEISYSGDPLRDFGLSPFLDKFAYRNPKTSKKLQRGESVAERRSGTEGAEHALKALPVNDPSFLHKEDIDEQEEFYYKFFAERARRDDVKGIRDRDSSRADDEEEDAAFDMAEGINVDHHFEEGWDTDPEEEAFVDSLAEKLIEDAADGLEDLDDEDPEMEGWDDMYSDDDEPTGMGNASEDSEADDEDAFMDKMDDVSDSDESGDDGLEFSGGVPDEEPEDDAFMDAEDDESDSDDNHAEADESDDEDLEGDLMLMAASDSEEDEPEVTQKKKPRKGKAEEDAFADASEYEELINKAWEERKRTLQPDVQSEEIETETHEIAAMKGKKKHRRRAKKRKASQA